MKKKYKIAFSMVELSVVLIIISVIIGSVIAANKISYASKLSVARSLTASSPVKDMDGLFVWLETTMPQSIDNSDIGSNRPVQVWHDLSPRHNDAVLGDNRTSCSGAALPVNTNSTCLAYRSNGINGLPSIFTSGDNGGGCYFRFDNYKQLEMSDYTIIVVEQFIRNTTNNSISMAIIAHSNTSTDTHGSLFIGYGDISGGNNIYFDDIGKVNNSDLLSNAGPLHYISSAQNVPKIHVFGLKQDYGKYYYLNGSNDSSIVPSQASNYYTSTVGKTPILNTIPECPSTSGNYFRSTIFLGSYNNNNYNGHLAEIIIFARSLRDNERREIEQYLSKKWNIPLLN
ncbi:MAG: hypothetical protein K0R25_201 [Rickettsiaceae bacterium]|nr:hypothetical protein [Rickettsiaceae bacterium]